MGSKKYQKEQSEKNKAWLKEYRAAWYQAHKEEWKAKVRARYAANKVAIRAREKELREEKKKANPEELSLQDMKSALRKNGWTWEAYQEASTSQNGLCAICGKSDGRLLSADHDHATGKPRGLLCIKCNLTLGTAKDSPEILEAAAAYLRKYQ